MKITKLHYFDTYEVYQGNRRFTKLGFEVEIDEEFDDVRDCFYKIKRKSEELFYESNKAAEKQKEVKEFTDEGFIHNEETPSLEDQINSCTEVKVLESYKLMVRGVPGLKKLYDKRLEDLKISS